MSAKLVIAEDEEGIRNNLARMLRLEGFEVWVGANGRQALDLVFQHLPDLVISDVMMPEMTGHQLLQALRSDPRSAHIPVVLLTARADRSDLREGMDLGADDYLTKPFQREEVLRSVHARLEKLAAQRLAAQRLSEQTHLLAHYDAATDLPNRGHWLLLLQDALNPSPPSGGQLLVCAVGIDNLPQLAHVLNAGGLDELVRELADRLRTAPALAPWGRLVPTRLAQDRLGLLAVQVSSQSPTTPTVEGQSVLQDMAHALLEHLAAPVQVDAEQHFPVLSVASVWVDTPPASAGSLLAQLELALGDARARPGRRVQVQAASGGADQGAAVRLHNDLHHAVVRAQLQAFYQPQIRTRTREVAGFEALMRWQHPVHGLVSPVRFIPLAEDNGQIVPMGAWMLTQACCDAMAWRAHQQPGSPPLRVAVNLSLRQFGDPALVDHVARALDVSGLPASQLELEITEGTAMLDLQHTLALLGRFKAMGCQLAIDDFGTGYSSLAYLKRFPLDVLKIDRSFVRQIVTDAEDRAIANAVITLAHSLDMAVIAEGVEEEAQHALLLDMGCDEIQGYLHGKPMPAAELGAWFAMRSA